MNKSDTIKMVSTLEMVGFLKTNGTQCRFVSLVSDTPVTKIKAACPFKNVRKVSKKIGLINANYNTSVRNRIAAIVGVELSEVEYTNGEVWYKHLTTEAGKNLPLVVNKNKDDGKHYIQYFPHSAESVYVCNGETIDKSVLEPYFYAEKPRPAYKPCVISLDLANICQLKASGVVIEMPKWEVASELLAD